MGEGNVGLEGSSVAKGRERELAQHQAWDTADLTSAEKLASIMSKSSKYDDQLNSFQQMAGLGGGLAAGISGLVQPPPPPGLPQGYQYGASGSPVLQGGYGTGVDDDEILRMLGLK
jgi:hypothetical protein